MDSVNKTGSDKKQRPLITPQNIQSPAHAWFTFNDPTLSTIVKTSSARPGPSSVRSGRVPISRSPSTNI